AGEWRVGARAGSVGNAPFAVAAPRAQKTRVRWAVPTLQIAIAVGWAPPTTMTRQVATDIILENVRLPPRVCSWRDFLLHALRAQASAHFCKRNQRPIAAKR